VRNGEGNIASNAKQKQHQSVSPWTRTASVVENTLTSSKHQHNNAGLMAKMS